MTEKQSKLSEMFDKARKQAPVLSRNEARTLIQTSVKGSGQQPGSIFTKLTRNKTMQIITSAVAAIAVIGGLSFGIFGNDNQVEDSNTISRNETETVVNNDVASDISKTESVATEETSAAESKRKGGSQTAPTNRTGETTAADIKPFALKKIVIKSPTDIKSITEKIKKDNQVDIRGINIIELSDAELAELGIIVQTEGKIMFPASDIEELKDKHIITLTKTGISVGFGGENIDSKVIPDVAPRFVTDADGNRKLSIFSDKTAGVLLNTIYQTSGNTDIAIENPNAETKEITTTRSCVTNHSSYSVADKKIITTILNGNSISGVTASDTSVTATIQIIASESGEPLNMSSNVVIDSNAMQNMVKMIVANSVDGMQESGNLDVSELTYELKTVLKNNLPDSLKNIEFGPNSISIDAFNVKKSEFDGLTELKFGALNADTKIFVHEHDYDNFMRINKLIPIAVRIDSKAIDYILWFDPSPELVKNLPERIKSDLGSEILALEGKENYCDGLPIAGEDSYLDVWRSCNGIIKNMTVSPNPTSGDINIKYILNRESKISITVHNLFGTKVVDLSTPSSKAPGQYTDFFNLDVDPGMYLISVQTDEGDQAVQRIIVE